MTGPRHRLDAVLRARRAQEDLARLRLADANRDLHREQAALLAATARYDRRPPLPDACGVADLLGAHQAAGLLAAGVAVARTSVVAADLGAGLRRVEWSEAARRVAALERLAERRRREHDAEVRRRDELAVDDLVTSRWVRRAGVGDGRGER